MAKLEGVKTLDMVNGEITKVAYGGEAYERVEGEAQKGDLLMMKNDVRLDTAPGAFYYVMSLGNGKAKILDDVDLPHTWSREYYELFRKVADATNPSVEERVAKAEGEIESLKSDVAALKGVAEPKPERLKVGDYAKVVGDESGHYAKINDIVQVTFDGGGSTPFGCDDLGGEHVGWFYADELVRATDEEVAEAKRAAARAKFKEGAKVRLLSGGGNYLLNGFENGKVYEVSDNNFDHKMRGKGIRIEGGDCFDGSGFATPDQLEILSEEEAAEIERKQAEEAKWAEIGREVGEYKVGDIFRSPGGNLFEITRIDDRSTFPIIFTNLQGDYDGYKRGAAITLVTPVEARFDR